MGFMLQLVYDVGIWAHRVSAAAVSLSGMLHDGGRDHSFARSDENTARPEGVLSEHQSNRTVTLPNNPLILCFGHLFFAILLIISLLLDSCFKKLVNWQFESRSCT